MNGYHSVLLDTLLVVRGEGRAPETPATRSARFNELGNIYLTGDMALLTGPLKSRD